MRNILLPPVSSQLFPNYFVSGNNDSLIPDLDGSIVVDYNLNVLGTSCYLESKLFNEGNNLRDGLIRFPNYPSPLNYQQGLNYGENQGSWTNLYENNISGSNRRFLQIANYGQPTFFNADNNMQQTMPLNKGGSLPVFEMDFEVKAIQAIKRPIEEITSSLLPQGGTNNVIIENKSFNLGDFNNYINNHNKRKKTINYSQGSHHLKDTKNMQVQKGPVRRSQKLSDKITALQKLVSPYGKTDTAAVLQEAVLYIKLLQEEIQNLFQMLSCGSSQSNAITFEKLQGLGGKMHLDLKSRGLCLVPVLLTKRITGIDQVGEPHTFYSETK